MWLLWIPVVAVGWFVSVSVAIFLGERALPFAAPAVALAAIALLCFLAGLLATWLAVRLGRAPTRIWLVPVVEAILIVVALGVIRLWVLSLVAAAPSDPDTQQLIQATAPMLGSGRLLLATGLDSIKYAAATLGAFLGCVLAKRFNLTRRRRR